jgi:hypothetical protein
MQGTGVGIPKKHGPGWHIAWMMPLVFIELVAVLALFTEQATLGFTQDASIFEAVASGARAKGLSSLMRIELVFVPVSIGAMVASEILLRRPLPLSAAKVIALVRALTGFLVGSLASPTLALISPVFVPLFTLGGLAGNGEFYEDGTFFYAAVGWWVWYQLALYLRDTRGRRVPSHECARCGYPTVSRDRVMPCPECGNVA